MSRYMRTLHQISLGANAVCLLTACYYGWGLFAGWAIVNLACSTTALRKQTVGGVV